MTSFTHFQAIAVACLLLLGNFCTAVDNDNQNLLADKINPTKAPVSRRTHTGAPVAKRSKKPTSRKFPPTVAPSTPTFAPTAKPSSAPTISISPSKPSKAPSSSPSFRPTSVPTSKPSKAPSAEPTPRPSSVPSFKPTSVPTAKPNNDGLTARQIEFATAHNFYRSEIVNANIPDLSYSTSLEAACQVYADYLAANNLFKHSGAAGVGENLWGGPTGATPTNMISGFGQEKQWFKYGLFPGNVSTTGNWGAVGHYTQIIWRTTQHFGCAGASSSSGRYTLVCQYSPPGNYYGRYVY